MEAQAEVLPAGNLASEITRTEAPVTMVKYHIPLATMMVAIILPEALVRFAGAIFAEILLSADLKRRTNHVPIDKPQAWTDRCASAIVADLAAGGAVAADRQALMRQRADQASRLSSTGATLDINEVGDYLATAQTRPSIGAALDTDYRGSIKPTHRSDVRRALLEIVDLAGHMTAGEPCPCFACHCAEAGDWRTVCDRQGAPEVALRALYTEAVGIGFPELPRWDGRPPLRLDIVPPPYDPMADF